MRCSSPVRLPRSPGCRWGWGPRSSTWPGLLVGDLLANDYGSLPLGSALGQTCGNVLEVLVATLLLRRLVPRGDPLGSVTGVGGMLVAIATGTVVSASIGMT